MSQQLYFANVVFGANITNYFTVVANTVQEAAEVAARAYDQNTTVFLANGAARSYGAANRINAAGSNNATITVFVKDPGAPLLGPSGTANTNAWQISVTTAAIAVPAVATYSATGLNAPSVIN